MEIVKTYVVAVPKRSVLERQLFQKLHFSKDGRYFLDSGRALMQISTEEATELLNAKP